MKVKGNNKVTKSKKGKLWSYFGLGFVGLLGTLCFYDLFQQADVKELVDSLAIDTATATTKTTQTSSLAAAAWDPKLNPLGIPPGKAQNLPSIRVKDKELSAARRRYGGQGDKKHLGGFAQIDNGGISPGLFKKMVEEYGVHSFLDVGCGRGWSTSWFAFHGVDVLCVEGSHDAIQNSVLPDPSSQHVEHDFSRGPWWPEKTYDVAWSVEFLEHVGVQFHYNYFQAFRKAALIFVTSSSGPGWHHVEVHTTKWWIKKYESYGLKYSPELSKQVQQWAKENKKTYTGPKGFYDGFYIRKNMKVFINPMVASLPEHAHLFPEFGCYQGKGEPGEMLLRECDEKYNETPLPKSFYPLKLTPEMDDKWNAWVESHYKMAQK